ncbi:hypothetical protein [Latilactobacillus fragifolii]|uniref:hypothetical protein n=1 Tax=Latilactobacillus fragifolii TaxID=2814244 RepID=UPI001ABB4BE7|nr:hypothetical protein [Latilactobacillus fragifolii]
MIHSPMTEYLHDIQEKLEPLEYPIYFRLPNDSVQEPFIVVGNHADDDYLSAKSDLVIETNLQIDIFLPDSSSTDLEDILYTAKTLLGRRQNITSQVLVDNSIGRQVFHIVITIKDLII